jgi:cation transport ATPase
MPEEPSTDTPASPPADSNPEEDVGQPGYTGPVDERTLSRAAWRAQRRAERRSRRGSGASWILGAILIVLGLGFLAQTFGRIAFNNWWALFIFIPVVGLFAAAGRRYQAAGGRVTGGVLGSAIGGLVLSAVALAFLFNLNLALNWNFFWPLLLILGGVALLLLAVTR